MTNFWKQKLCRWLGWHDWEKTKASIRNTLFRMKPKLCRFGLHDFCSDWSKNGDGENATCRWCPKEMESGK